MISNEIILNVITNVINITLAILTVFTAMDILKRIIYFVLNAFKGMGVIDRIKFKSQGLLSKDKKL